MERFLGTFTLWPLKKQRSNEGCTAPDAPGRALDFTDASEETNA